MRMSTKWLQGVLAVVLLTIVVAGMAMLLRGGLPTGVETASAGAVLLEQSDSPLPTPIVEGTVLAPPAPIPTHTPRPTPTRQPGPTATALPLPTIAENPSGLIQFAVDASEQEAMRTHYALQVDAGADIAGEPVVIDVPTGIDFTPSAIFYSPNHQYVVYMQPVEPGGLPSVYDAHADEVSKLFEAYSGGRFLGWHPDGKRFLFWIDSVALWLINAETTEMITLAYPEGPLQGAAISPDGLNVFYIADTVRGVDNNQTIYGDTLWSVSSAGSDAKPYPAVGEAYYIYPNAWYPNSEKVLYYGICNAGDQDSNELVIAGLCIFETRTAVANPLDPLYAGYEPQWSPDGRFIAATGVNPEEKGCEKGDNADAVNCLYQGRSIYLIDVETAKVSLLTEGIAPVWAPDGSSIAFLSNRTGTPEIWLINQATQELHQLTTLGQSIITGSLHWKAQAN